MADSKEAQFQPAVSQQIQLFTSADGQAQLQVALEHETVWLSLQQLTELCARDKSVISRHLKNIFNSNKLQRADGALGCPCQDQPECSTECADAKADVQPAKSPVECEHFCAERPEP